MEGATERASRLPDYRWIEIVDEEIESGFVDGDRTQHVALSREGDERKSIVGRKPAKAIDNLLHFRETIRLLILSEHRRGCIEREYHIDARLPYDSPLDSPARAGKPNGDEKCRERKP